VTIDIRTIRPDEVAAYLDAGTAAFHERPKDLAAIAAAVTPHWDLSRAWGAFDGSTVVASFRSFDTELTLPGGRQIQASAIAGVGVMPTYRRRGVLRRLAAAEHAAMRERGDVIGLLNASEYPIYGRFGYGVACRQAIWKLDTRATGGFHGEPTGSIDLIPPDEASLPVLLRIYEAVRLARVGEIRRREISWRMQLGLEPDPWDDGWRGFVVVHRDAQGQPDGFARYHSESKWEERQPRQIVHVDDLHALDDATEADLWRFLAGIDWVATLRAERRSPSERLPWLITNHRAASIVEQGDGMFARLHDLPRALEARTYAGEGSVVLEVVDPERPESPERVLLDVSPDGARCTPTDRTPDLTIHLAALSGAYLGGTPLSRIAIAFGGADEGSAGAMTRVERLFRTLDEPWCSTFF
jgi:predicted acetyltransferase